MRPVSVLVSLALPLIYWVAVVVLVTLFGYPGVVLMTPLAWLLALIVGRDTVLRADDPRSPGALVGAAGGGALFGLVLGVVFGVASLVLGGVSPDEENGLRILTLVVTGAGVPICAAIAVGMGLLVRRRT